MGSHLLPDASADEDYINMELISSPAKSLRCRSSPQNQIKEFEFQYFSASNHHKSAADELFYKGKLLPLHLPPRRQMVERLLRTSTADDDDHRRYPLPFLTCSTAPCTNSNTPLDSCNISPAESCRVSCELNPNDTLFEWPTEFSSFFKNQPRNNPSWSKKLKQKLIKHSFLSQKLKSSRAYLKSLFIKSACSEESSAQNSSSKVDANKYSKIGKKFATLNKKNGIDDDNSHRRSFSGAITAHSTTTKCVSNSSSSLSSSSTASTSSSFNSNELKLFRRSSSAAEIEVSIDAAIAHCKKSMQSFGIN
ncbi:hypothetical protein C2S53_007122 [Perilla frutescens var. hirtella]|uniref:Membrane-associated kinase regulator 4 n=1 Tax=Perilla frutescens var. hirtella TaxID=608512 RepID=A0AAD4NXM8_PERFH|nr:hypothetical protein C2S53_007122 [Perilla frutescens var. hirtella]